MLWVALKDPLWTLRRARKRIPSGTRAAVCRPRGRGSPGGPQTVLLRDGASRDCRSIQA